MMARRRRRLRRVRGLGVIVPLAVVLLAGLIIHGIYSGARHAGPYLSATNTTFAAQINTVFDAQQVQGSKLESLLVDMPNLDRGVLALRLRELVNATDGSARSAELAATPAPSADAGSRAQEIVSSRASATSDLASAIQGLLGLPVPPVPGTTASLAAPKAVVLIPTSVAIDRLTSAGHTLKSADQKVGRLRADLAVAPGHAELQRSVFISDHALLGRSSMVALVDALQSSPSLQPQHRVTLTTVTTVPGVLPTTTAFDLALIPPTTSIDVLATLSNLGNVDEPNVTVVASILSPQGTVLSQVRSTEAIRSGSATAFHLGGLSVTPGTGVILLVAVSPPPGQSGSANLAQRWGLSIAPLTPTTKIKP